MRVGIGDGRDDMTFEECLDHVKKVMFWDPVDGLWNALTILYESEWDELVRLIVDAHEREIESRGDEDGV